MHPSKVFIHRTKTAASITLPLATTGGKDNAMTNIILIGQKPNVTKLMVTFTVQDVTCLTITALA